MRSYQSGLPENMVLYSLTLTDASRIPLTKLGSQALSVSIPVPEALQGQELRVVTLDRNGQLERLEAAIADDTKIVRFSMNSPSMIGIYGLAENGGID